MTTNMHETTPARTARRTGRLPESDYARRELRDDARRVTRWLRELLDLVDLHYAAAKGADQRARDQRSAPDRAARALRRNERLGERIETLLCDGRLARVGELEECLDWEAGEFSGIILQHFPAGRYDPAALEAGCTLWHRLKTEHLPQLHALCERLDCSRGQREPAPNFAQPTGSVSVPPIAPNDRTRAGAPQAGQAGASGEITAASAQPHATDLPPWERVRVDVEQERVYVDGVEHRVRDRRQLLYLQELVVAEGRFLSGEELGERVPELRPVAKRLGQKVRNKLPLALLPFTEAEAGKGHRLIVPDRVRAD